MEASIGAISTGPLCNAGCKLPARFAVRTSLGSKRRRLGCELSRLLASTLCKEGESGLARSECVECESVASSSCTDDARRRSRVAEGSEKWTWSPGFRESD